VADIEFTIERDGYPPIALNSDGGGQYGFTSSTQGLGVGPVIARTREGAGDGVQYVGDKVAAKAADLGLEFLGNGRLSTGELIRNLRNLLRWRANQPFPRLVATWANGDIVEMPVVYASGLEMDYTKALPDRYETVVAVTCPDPFWTARDALQFSFENTATATPFLDDLITLPIASSLIGESLTVPNIGDIETDLTVVFKGPSTGATSVLVDGVGWVFETILSGSEIITVARTPRGITITDQTGANRYADLASVPKFPQLPPGESVVAGSMVGADTDSYIRGFWRPRLEGVY
jgi:hypothetical protein